MKVLTAATLVALTTSAAAQSFAHLNPAVQGILVGYYGHELCDIPISRKMEMVARNMVVQHSVTTPIIEEAAVAAMLGFYNKENEFCAMVRAQADALND